jgi:hypothetical protein
MRSNPRARSSPATLSHVLSSAEPAPAPSRSRHGHGPPPPGRPGPSPAQGQPCSATCSARPSQHPLPLGRGTATDLRPGSSRPVPSHAQARGQPCPSRGPKSSPTPNQAHPAPALAIPRTRPGPRARSKPAMPSPAACPARLSPHSVPPGPSQTWPGRRPSNHRSTNPSANSRPVMPSPKAQAQLKATSPAQSNKPSPTPHLAHPAPALVRPRHQAQPAWPRPRPGQSRPPDLLRGTQPNPGLPSLF